MKTAKTIGFAGLFFANILAAFAWTYSPTSKEIGVNGGSFTLTVSGTEYYDWNAGVTTWSKGGVIQDTDADWITVTRVNEKTFSVTVTANNTSDERWAYVTINAFQGGTTHSAQTHVNFQHCSVTQAGQNKPTVNPTEISFSRAGGDSIVDVMAASGDTWYVSESISWLTANISSSRGNGRVVLSAAENASFFPRTNSLMIAGHEITVSQDGEPGYSRIVYGNLQGARNPNPEYYKEGEGLELKPLPDVATLSFVGWSPEFISFKSTGPVYVEAIWKTNYINLAIEDVRAEQIVPWKGDVRVSYSVMGDFESWAKKTGRMLSVSVAVVDDVNGSTKTVTRLSGDMALTPGTHSFVWDSEAEGLVLNGNYRIELSAVVQNAEYFVIDLSSGSNSTNYPVTYLPGIPDGGWPNDCKSSKLVLRRIEPGVVEKRGLYPVKLTKPYYIGIYETTVDQNSYIVDMSKVNGNVTAVEAEDVIRVNDKGGLRGKWDWPESSDVAEQSVIGMLRARTGLMLDLPTEAQWEYACRAGTKTNYYWGDRWADCCRYAWVYCPPDVVVDEIQEVGKKLPNAWGLYDMIGNVWEVCLDWHWSGVGDGPEGMSGIDAGGPETGSYRVVRGQYYRGSDVWCTSSYCYDIWDAKGNVGYRLCLPIEENCIPVLGTNCISGTVSINTVEKIHKPDVQVSSVVGDMCHLNISWVNGWVVYYTIDGTIPDSASGVYNAKDGLVVCMRGGVIVKAVAISPVGEKSEVATFEIPAPNPPTISPTSGTIIGSSVSVNIASDNPNATIYYTTDGTEPTTDSPVYSRFKASKKMTVKAIAVVDGMAWSETATAEYALGQCADPTITPADGAVFDNSNYQVSIAKNGEKGVLRYTTDGSDPTATSPIYAGPFTINVTTTIKAKTFDSEYFDSAIVSSTLTRHWTKVATPIIDAAERFSGTKTSVSLSCDTEGAVIRYTIDGSEPNSHSPKYTGMFEVTATTVVKAIALRTDCENSDVAILTITREWGIGDALNDPDRRFVTDSGTGWVRDVAVSHDGSESMRSGAIANSVAMGVYSTSTLSTVVDGKGVVRFLWKASCEEDGEFEWDHGEFQVDGVMVARINGETGWEAMSYEITTDGNHVLSWVYFKDDFGSEGDDCIWLDEFNWTPPPAALSSLHIEGDERVVDGREKIYSCTADYDDGTSVQVSPVWTIVSGDDCATINSAGVLTAKKVGKAVVSATYTDAGVTKTATMSVMIVKGLSSVEITGPTSVYAGDSAVYSCLATYTDGSAEAVNADWMLMNGSGCATLSSAGTLTALDADGTATIKASFTYEGETKTATYSVGVSRQIIVDADVTGGSAAFVPVSWVNQYPTFRTLYGSDLVAAMAMLTGKKDGSGKQLNVWHDYVAGTDPTDVNDVFQAIIEFEAGLPKVSWRPNLNEKGEVRTYKVYGRRSLSNSDAWEYPANSAEHQFFKVDVSMPGVGDGGSDSPGVIEVWQFVALPTAVSGLVYDGIVKQGVLPGTGYTLSGASATGAGNYTAVATLASGFKWESGSQANQQIPWSIAKANNAWVSVPTMSATTFLAGSAVTVTDGVSKFGTVTRNYSNSAIQSLSAGSYTLVSTVAGTANYTGLTHSIPFTVTAPATKIALPSAKTGLVYTGSTQTGVATGTGYTLSGNTGINAGTYTATATLKSGYEWSDGVSSQSRTISWSIAKATNSWLTQPSLSSTEFEEGSSVTISMGSVKFGVRQSNYTAAELAQLTVGSYSLVVSVTGTDNYTGLTKSIPFTVTAKQAVENLYCVIDLSAGASAKSYPVEYVDAEPSGGWGDVHKTTKLVLRRVEKGSFSMMSKGKTSISKDYYIGVFEVTQKQYELVMGTNPAIGYGVGDTLPVYKVSYDDIRGVSAGAGWPTSSAVDGESFLGKLRARTSIDFDLPTEAQWEYACRAGTTGKYYWTEAGLATSLCAWYVSNSGYVTHNVGTKRSNDWGIFDMSGNVSEWCRDWYSSTLAYGSDPKGAASASYNRRVTRGGCYSSGESDLRMDDTYYRSGIDAATQSSSTGFRLVMPE